MANSVIGVTCEPRRSRLVAMTAVAAMLAVAACSTDGREMTPPRPGQVQTIIDSTVPDPAVIDEAVINGAVIDGAAADQTVVTLPPPAGAFTLSAPWAEGGPIPVDHTCSGDGVSPSLAWSGAPIETQSFAVVVTDLDARGPTGESLVHWVVANIDPFITAFPTGGAVAGAIEGINDLGRPDVPIVGWSPPCPPRGETHTYAVTLHALGQRLDLLDGTPGADLVRAIELASLSTSTVTGTVTS